ncbi:MAG TPA: GlsB/YeaQ/YmgE family stress response membrane protein [Bacteroidota bacterium]|nr:GlsB/YeaQ/YmgE family stress response membrane protein [Bacteroidota bacterium]
MSTEHLLLFLFIGILAGFIAGKIFKGSGFGLVGDLIVGVIGAFIGGWVFGLLGITSGGIIGLLIASVVGALILLYVIRLARSKR